MKIVQNPIDFRNNVRKMIQFYIPKDSASSNIEISIYNETLDISEKNNIIKKWDNPFFIELYKSRLRSVIMNLSSNSKLKEKIMNKTIKSYNVGKMTHQEMDPNKWAQLIEEKKMKDDDRYAPKLEASTDNFTCRKCKSNKCSYYQLQTRSADEPMTTFVTCINCGNRWKC